MLLVLGLLYHLYTSFRGGVLLLITAPSGVATLGRLHSAPIGPFKFGMIG